MMSEPVPEFIIPDWPAPPSVKAVSSTRCGGASAGCWSSFNVGQHVGDRPTAVQQNRERFARYSEMPTLPSWLEQVHSNKVVKLPANTPNELVADAAYSVNKGVVCTVMTADCMPLLLCNKEGTQVAAIHAGWRGLCDGVIENTLAHFELPESILAWMGPAISQHAFEVGDDVRQAFIRQHPQSSVAFIPGKNHGKWMADLYQLARIRLAARGVTAVYGGSFCTYTEHDRFFSYRRDGQTGRMASAIWLI